MQQWQQQRQHGILSNEFFAWLKFASLNSIENQVTFFSIFYRFETWIWNRVSFLSNTKTKLNTCDLFVIFYGFSFTSRPSVILIECFISKMNENLCKAFNTWKFWLKVWVSEWMYAYVARECCSFIITTSLSKLKKKSINNMWIWHGCMFQYHHHHYHQHHRWLVRLVSNFQKAPTMRCSIRHGKQKEHFQ